MPPAPQVLKTKSFTSKFRFPSLQTADDPSPQAPLPMLKSTITGAASTSLSAHKKTKGRGFCEGDADLHSRLASRDFESLGTDDGPGPQRCTSKAEPYKIGERTTDIMLEILNLDKKEVVSINGISNQEFTEMGVREYDQRENIRYGDSQPSSGFLGTQHFAQPNMTRTSKPTRFTLNEQETSQQLIGK
ncbi:hypothetical protein ES288_D07G279500v1 [Gossypium darwinii]|uniref:Uncharacterized protein n=1 Tax=Gossypium darwinii TaxID=34276 RepID=A0A5D2C3V1_GOSDA|nr:hypothetical protein ES288_D07G279500v1 [Gossypium darwinii]